MPKKKKKPVRRAKKATKIKAKKTTKRKAPAKRKTTKKSKTVKRKSKRRKSSGRVERHHIVLKEALQDIARELSSLRTEKNDLEGIMDDVAGDITATQNKEVQLKDQLRKLNSVENGLTLKRNRMRKKLELTRQKISKVRQLSNQMENI